MEKLERNKIEKVDRVSKLDSIFDRLPSRFELPNVGKPEAEKKRNNVMDLEKKIPQEMQKFVESEDLPALKYCIKDGAIIINEMYQGKEVNGERTRGLKQISVMKVNPEFADQNLKQQAGFSAEVISTAKDNIIADIKKTGIKTYRADDRSDLYPRNDQYVDKFRVDRNGKIIERIQCKFIEIGKSPEDCLKKLMSKKFDKYFNDGKVDKIEISKEKYDGIRKGNLISKNIEELNNQLKYVEKNSPEATAINAKIDRLNKIDKMIIRSSCSEKEAMDARINPQKYVENAFSKEFFSI